jgi:hypothetical protein
MGLALFEIDKAIMNKRPIEPTLLDIPKDLGVDAKAKWEKQNSKLMSYYEIEKINWERSNRKYLMVIKERISESIQGAIPECETAVEYLEKVESQFTGSSKSYTSSLIKRLVSEKYTGGGVRDHILRMSNVAARLKPLIWLSRMVSWSIWSLIHSRRNSKPSRWTTTPWMTNGHSRSS